MKEINLDKGKLELGDERYPEKINLFVKNKAPLYYEGDLSLTDRPAVGIVGTRRCTKYGLAVTKEIARRAASYGIVVVSGVARGIDSAAHREVLQAGGQTIGVVGCGLDVVYPKENKDLYEKIKKHSLMLSEYPPGTQAHPGFFPHRNRLISALSEAIVVVEAATRSGSLITAECAVEQGKEVFAVPGNITNIYSMGPNKLIRDGAKALVIIDDLFSEIIKRRNAGKIVGMDRNLNALEGLGDDEKRILELIAGLGEVPLGEIAEKVDMTVSETNGIITVLEMKGLIFCEMGRVSISNFA